MFLADGLPPRAPVRIVAVHLRLDSKMMDRKMVALRAQAGQTGPLIAALGEDRVRHWFDTGTFVAGDAVAVGRSDWGTWRPAA